MIKCGSKRDVVLMQLILTQKGPVFTKGKRRYFPVVWPLFTKKPCFYHRKRFFLKPLAKVDISENAGYVLPCQLGETGF